MPRATLSAALMLASALAARADGPKAKDADVVKVDPEAYAVEVKKDAKAAAAKYKGKKIEMAGVVAWMLSDTAAYLTGQMIYVDGGYIMSS